MTTEQRKFQMSNFQSLYRNSSISFTLLMSAVAFDAAAAEKEGENPDQEETSRHRVELFLGETHDEGEDAFSVGLTYKYRLNKLIGLGVFWEYVAGDFDKWSAGVPLFLHPYKGLRFAVAPGMEYEDSDEEFLVRLGVAYEFERGRGDECHVNQE